MQDAASGKQAVPNSTLVALLHALATLPVLPPLGWGLLGASLLSLGDTDGNGSLAGALAELMASPALARSGGALKIQPITGGERVSCA